MLNTIILFILTAVSEIIGCYLPYMWLRHDASIWLLIPSTLCLLTFVWLLSLHPAESGRVYAAYGGIYVSVAFIWLILIDDIQPTKWDFVGISFTITGTLIIIYCNKM